MNECLLSSTSDVHVSMVSFSGDTEECKDLDDKCDDYDKDDCQLLPDYMMQNCKAACKFCGPGRKPLKCYYKQSCFKPSLIGSFVWLDKSFNIVAAYAASPQREILKSHRSTSRQEIREQSTASLLYFAYVATWVSEHRLAKSSLDAIVEIHVPKLERNVKNCKKY